MSHSYSTLIYSPAQLPSSFDLTLGLDLSLELLVSIALIGSAAACIYRMHCAFAKRHVVSASLSPPFILRLDPDIPTSLLTDHADNSSVLFFAMQLGEVKPAKTMADHLLPVVVAAAAAPRLDVT